VPASQKTAWPPGRGSAVRELTRPFVRVWDYAAEVGGFPGQLFLVVACVMLVVGFLTWLGNKK
jgi:hypothetical protein